jgi:hypothetical protein
MGAAVAAAMLDAHRAGLSVIPVRSNKRPGRSSWAEFIDTQPNELSVRGWANSTDGFAILCGGPTRLQVLDFEGRFTEHIPELKVRLGSLASVFESWVDGYMVTTPGGGFHVAVHVEGSDTQAGNTKLAMDASAMTLVETRGHGGYVVAAPSNGTTHPSGGSWVQSRGSFAEIAWATVEEWQGVCSAISTFDAVAAASETPPEVPHSPVLAGGVSLSRIEHTSSWLDDVRMPPMAMFLENNGWTYSHSDADHSYWARPGKDAREGHSATINASDRLFVFSTNAHPVPSSQPSGQTYDVTDLIGCYRFGHLPSSDERVAIKREFAGLSVQHPPAAPESPAPPATWLPDDFWESKPWLSAIRQAAWGAQRCPEAILGAVLATYAVGLPSSIKVEALVGGNESPLNTYVALVGKSGSGKTGAIGLAMQLLGVRDSQDHRYGVSLRSGEGLITAAIAEPAKRDKQGLELPAVFRRGVLVEFDEGKALAQQSDRSGSTMLSYLLTAWSGRHGSRVGGTKAAGDESFPADMVRICAVMGIQLGVAGSLFTGEARDQGFPGRLLYFGMNNLGDRSLRSRGKPPELGLPFYYPEQGREIGAMTFPSEVEEAVSEWDYLRNTEGGDVIDGHRMLLRMRTACVLALMDRHAQVDLVHWELAGEIERHSLAMRSSLLAGISRSVEERAHAAGRIDAVREQGRLSATHERLAQRLARGLARVTKVDSEQGVPRKQWRGFFAANERDGLTAIVDIAIARGWAAYAPDEASNRLRVGSAWPG